MSGYKRATVTIGEDEYDRLRDAENKLRSLPKVRDEAYRAISQKSEQALKSNFTKIEKRQEAYESLLSGMGDMIRGIESATAQVMLEHEASAAAQIQQYAGHLWDHVDQVLAAHAESFMNSVAASHQQLQDEISQYAWQVRRMAADQDSKQALAYEWFEAASQLCAFIKQNYDHDHFTPGQVASLERELDQARENLEMGLVEGVIITTQQLYRSFSDLRIQLERLEAEWRFLIESALETVGQIVVEAEESRVVPAVDLDGNLLPVAIQVDFWTQGRLSQFIDNLQSIGDQLAAEQDLPDSATLQNWLQKEVPVYYQALEETVLNARITALNSQLRINIADMVVRSLQEQGFALATSNYEAGDMRAAYNARMTNLEGNQVMVQVTPTGPELGENELHLQSFDREERTEHELQRRWFEVSQALSSYGVNVGAYIREDVGPYSTAPGKAAGRQESPFGKRTRTNGHYLG